MPTCQAAACRLSRLHPRLYKCAAPGADGPLSLIDPQVWQTPPTAIITNSIGLAVVALNDLVVDSLNSSCYASPCDASWTVVRRARQSTHLQRPLGSSCLARGDAH